MRLISVTGACPCPSQTPHLNRPTNQPSNQPTNHPSNHPSHQSGGEWISSIDIEKHLAAMHVFASVAVVAQPHPRWDERPVVVGTLAAGVGAGAASTAKVREFCASSFAKYELPEEVVLWDALPMTGTGKIDKKRIRAMLSEQGYKLPDLRARL